VVDIGYDGAAPALWRTFMIVLSSGGLLFASGLSVSVYGVAQSLVPSRLRPAIEIDPIRTWTKEPVTASPAWTGPIAVVALVVAMYGATIGAFELMHALPITASGGGGH
jgi:hypothetical protein